MTTITQRKKLSKGTWALIIFAFVGVIVVAVLGFLGIIDLSFLANWATGTMMFGASSWVNALIVFAAPFVLGILATYAIFTYFKGQQVTTHTGIGTGYNPMPTTPSASQKDTETVIS